MKNTIFILTVLFIVSCSSDDKTDFKAKNEQEITTYIADNNLNAIRSDTGLYYVTETEGNGEQPTTTSNVTVAYKGYYTNGNVFDESNAAGISFNLQQVIKGWTEGLTYFKTGGSGKLLVPAHLGYGNSTTRGIPGGSVLIFDINLISVN